MLQVRLRPLLKLVSLLVGYGRSARRKALDSLCSAPTAQERKGRRQDKGRPPWRSPLLGTKKGDAEVFLRLHRPRILQRPRDCVFQEGDRAGNNRAHRGLLQERKSRASHLVSDKETNPQHHNGG